MKKLGVYFSLLIFVSLLGSCIKNEDAVFGGSVAELDAATWNANFVGVTYPVLTRIPAMGRALTAACPDSTLRRFSGNIRIRVNLVGAPSGKEETVGFKTFDSPVTTISFPASLGFTTANPPAADPCRQLPMQASGSSVAVTNAVAGTHYRITSGTDKIIIPANSSFGYIDVQILNAGAAAGQARFLGIQLDETGTIKPSANYSQVGLVIDQR